MQNMRLFPVPSLSRASGGLSGASPQVSQNLPVRRPQLSRKPPSGCPAQKHTKGETGRSLVGRARFHRQSSLNRRTGSRTYGPSLSSSENERP
jgi:hypothetical protein